MMIRPTIRAFPALFLLLASCTVPDVSPEVAEAGTLLAATDARLRPALTPLAANELAAAEEAFMREGKTILALDGTCHYDEARQSGVVVTDCALTEFARPDKGAVNATSTLDALDAMAGYFAALAALASSQSSDEVAARTAGLIDALAALDHDGNPDGLRRAAQGAATRKDLVVRTAGFLAARYRIAALRKVVRRADPVFGRMVPVAAAYLDTLPGGLPAAQVRLEDAEEAMALAPTAGVAAHRAAAVELRAALAAFRAAEAASPANRLLLLRRLHAGLLKRLSGARSAEDLLATLEDIKAIVDLTEKGD